MKFERFHYALHGKTIIINIKSQLHTQYKNEKTNPDLNDIGIKGNRPPPQR